MVRPTAILRERRLGTEYHHQIRAVPIAQLLDCLRIAQFIKHDPGITVVVFHVGLFNADQSQAHSSTAVLVNAIRYRHDMMDASVWIAVVEIRKTRTIKCQHVDGRRPRL